MELKQFRLIYSIYLEKLIYTCALESEKKTIKLDLISSTQHSIKPNEPDGVTFACWLGIGLGSYRETGLVDR